MHPCHSITIYRMVHYELFTCANWLSWRRLLGVLVTCEMWN